MRSVLALSLLVALCATACDDDKRGPSATNDAGAGPDGSTAVGSVIEGLVQTTTGKPVANATVSVGGKETTTDEKGLFRVDGLEEGTVQVAVDDKKHAKSQTEANVKPEHKTTVALTTDDTVMVSMSNAEKGGVVEKDSVRIALPANSLKKSDGSNAKGTVQVYYTAVSSPDKAAVAPGGLKGSDSNKPVQLSASGMIDVRFYQGNEQLRFEGVADLRFPLLANARYADGEEIDIWSFDEALGRWLREGKGKVTREVTGQGVLVETKADHFTWWAAAEPLAEATCVSGRLLDLAGEPVAATQVSLRSFESLLATEQFSAADGSFCLPAPQESAVSVTAFGASDDKVWVWSWYAPIESEEAACGGACTELPAREPFLYGGDGIPQSDAGVDAGTGEPDAGDEQPDAGTSDAGSDAGEPDGSVVLPAEICTNGIDDDGDELVDCDDEADCGRDSIGCTTLALDGAEAYVYVGQIQEAPQLAGTVELWFRADDIGESTLIDLTSCGYNFINLTRSGQIFSAFARCELSTYSSTVLWDGPIEAGRWYHLARVWTDTTHQLYVDGVLVGESTHSEADINSGGFHVTVGCRHADFDYTPTGGYFPGRIDEVRVWTRARTAAELNTAMSTPIEPENNLTGYWRFDEGDNVVGFDSSGNEHAASLQGGATWFPLPPPR